MDISFLIPTNRGQDNINPTIESINRLNLNGLTHEICVYSETEIAGQNVRWFPETKRMGPSFGFNHMAYLTNSRYLAVLTDECEIPNPNTIGILINAINDLGPSRAVKIVGFSVNEGVPFFTPTQGQRFGNIIKLNHPMLRVPVARFPFITRDAFDNHLNQHIFHPEFRMYGNDIWLGWWLGLKGEPFKEVYEARVVHKSGHAKNHEWEMIDCNTTYVLYQNYQAGFTDYVCHEHPAYNRSTAPRKQLLHWT